MSKAQRNLYTAAVLISMMFMAAMGSIRGSLLTNMIDHYGLSDAQQGMPASVVNLGCMCALVFAFFLMGRIKKPLLLLISAAATMLLLIPQGMLPAYGLFIAFNFIFGLSNGIMDTLQSACMADVRRGEKSGMWMNILHASYGIAAMLAPLIFSAMLRHGVAWNRIYFIMAAAGMVFMLYFAPVSVRQARLADKGEKMTLSLKVIKEYFSDRTLVTVTLCMLFFGLFFGSTNTWLMHFVNKSYTGQLGDKALAAAFLGVTCGRLVWPFTGIKPRRFLKIAGAAVWAIWTVSLFTKSGIAVCVFSFVAMFFSGPVIPYCADIGCSTVKGDSMMASTMLFLMMYIGQSLSSIFVGAFERGWSLSAGMELCYIFALLCSVTAIIGFRDKKGGEKA